MPRGKKSPNLKDAIAHKKTPQNPVPAKVQEVKAEEAPKPQRTPKAAKSTPTLEEIVEKLKHHGIHFDQE